MDLSTNAGVISEAMRFVSQKTEHMLDERIEATKIEQGEEDKTTNGVF
jgi:hypothetical protein